jgi:GT2 family glycosyltransferase
MDISIIIPTFNRNAILYKHLAVAYGELAGLDYEIIVINDSKQNTVEIPREWQANIYAADNPKQGAASARNLGASLARSQNLVFVDDDMLLNRNAIERTIKYLKENDNACLNINWVYPDTLKAKLDSYSFGRYLEHFGFTSMRGWQGNDFEWLDNRMIKANGVTSQFLAMSKSTFTQSGGYNESFPFAGFEDHDFSVRLEQQGIGIFLDTGTTILHDEEDRVQLDGWLQRKRRGGHTRCVAVEMGHTGLAVDYHNLKGNIYFIISKLDFIFKGLLKVIPNKKMFDPLYFRTVNILLGINLYKGYTQ